MWSLTNLKILKYVFERTQKAAIQNKTIKWKFMEGIIKLVLIML